MLRSQILKLLLQKSTHSNDTISHAFNLTQPLLVQSLVVENLGGDTGTVNGRVGVERSDEDLDL